MSDVLLAEAVGPVLHLTLNRPEQLNAFNDALYDAVTERLQEAASDERISVVVITGAGRAFSAGQDLAEMENPPVHDDEGRHGFVPFIETVESFPKPLIAAVNGIAVGIGLTLLPHCDLIFLSDQAKLRGPFVSLGVTVEAGNSYLLPATVGWQAASHLLYTASWIDAERAREMGLAFKVVPAQSLMDEALQVAGEIAAMPLASLTGTKQLLLDARLDMIRRARQRETETFARLVGGPANRAAIAAFKDKTR